MTAPREAASTAQEQAGAVAGTAKEQAAAVGSTATSAASDVTGTAREQAGQVVGEAVGQAKGLAGQVREQVGQQVGTQTEKATSVLRDLSRQLSEGDTSGVVGSVLTEVGQRVQGLADALEQKGPQGLVEDLRGFARRSPGTFLLGAALAGLVTGRLAKGMGVAPGGASSGVLGGGSTTAGATGTADYGIGVTATYDAPSPATYGTAGGSTTGTATGDPLAGLVPAGGTASGSDHPPLADDGLTQDDLARSGRVSGTVPELPDPLPPSTAGTPYPGVDEPPYEAGYGNTAPYGTRGAL